MSDPIMLEDKAQVRWSQRQAGDLWVKGTEPFDAYAKPTGNALALAIINALDLDTTDLVSLSIHFTVDKGINITVTRSTNWFQYHAKWDSSEGDYRIEGRAKA